MIHNDVIDTMMSRYSCRDFDTAREVTDEQLQTLVESGKYVANGGNAQGWHFTVIRTQRGKDLLIKAIGETPPAGYPEGWSWPVTPDFNGAPAIIVVSGDPTARYCECGYHMAAGNIMNAAVSLGLASMWSTGYTKDLFRDEEGRSIRAELIPEGYVVYATLFVGYAKNPGTQSQPRREGVETWV